MVVDQLQDILTMEWISNQIKDKYKSSKLTFTLLKLNRLSDREINKWNKITLKMCSTKVHINWSWINNFRLKDQTKYQYQVHPLSMLTSRSTSKDSQIITVIKKGSFNSNKCRMNRIRVSTNKVITEGLLNWN